MDTVLNRLAGHGTPAHRVWLPPLDRCRRTRCSAATPVEWPLRVPIGLVDCPFEQRRDVLIVELAGAAGNVAIVGAPQSGKSTALRTLVMARWPPPTTPLGAVLLPGLRRRRVVVVAANCRMWDRWRDGRDVDLCRRTVAELESVLRAREAASAASASIR